MRKRNNSARLASPAKTGRRKLFVQSLEQRSLLAADIGLADGYVQIHGTEHNDVAEIFQQEDQLIVNYMQFDASGNLLEESQHAFELDKAQGIFFEGGAGNDVFANESNVSSLAMGGPGADMLLGGTAGDTLVGGGDNDVLLGGDGNDLLLGGSGENVLLDTSGNDVTPPVVEEPVDETPVEETPIDEEPHCPVDEAPVVEAPVEETPAEEAACPIDETALEEPPVEEPAGDPIADETAPPLVCSDGTILIDEPAETTDDETVPEGTADETPIVTAEEEVTDPAAETPIVECPEPPPVPEACAVPAESDVVTEEAPPAEEAAPVDEAVLDEEAPIAVCDAEAGELPPEIVTVDEGEESVPETTEEDASSPAAVTDEPGNDILVGGAGHDLLFGGEGDDWVFGDAMPEDLLAQLTLNQFPWHQGNAV